MPRLHLLMGLVGIVVAAFMLYTVKYEVQSLQAQIAETAHELEEEKEALNVAAAEWAYLNRPERLQQLASKYLASSGVTVEQIAEIEAIGFPKQMEAAAPEATPDAPEMLKTASYHAEQLGAAE